MAQAVVADLVIWTVYWSINQRTTDYTVFGDYLPLAIGVALFVGAGFWRLQRTPDDAGRLLLIGPQLVLFVLWFFTLAYYQQGTATNFTEPLSHADALYFAVATMTTTGFGDVQPTSAHLRLLVTAQMLVSMLVTVGFLAAVVAKTLGRAHQPTDGAA